MKSNQLQILIIVFSLLSIVYSQVDVSEFNQRCVSCIKNDPVNNYYCTKNDTCTQTFIDNYSCDKDIYVCLNYDSFDLGVFEIPPFSKVKKNEQITLDNGQSLRFGISNLHFTDKAWIEIQVGPLDTSQGKYTSTPNQVVINSFNGSSNNITGNYIYSTSGRTYINSSSSQFYFVGANNEGMTVYLTYGNTKNQARVGVAITFISIMIIGIQFLL